MNGDQRRAAEPRPLDADEPGGVRLGEDLDVLALRRPEPMQHHPERSMALVLLDIEKTLRVAGPDDVAGRIDETVGEVRAALDVAHPYGQDLRAEIVGAPGELRVVGRMTRGFEVEERLAFGACVAVDQHRLVAALSRPSAIDAVLAAGAEPGIIGPWPVDLRRLAVVLLEPRAHLGDKRLLQIARRGERRFGISVLRLEQRADVARQAVR